MAGTTVKHTSMRIGVQNLCFAKLLEDDGLKAPTWDTIVKTLGLMKIGINPNASQESAFYDDGPNETASTLGKLDVEIDKSSLSVSELAYLLGKKIDTNGCIIDGAEDTPPYVAVGFQSQHGDGTNEYVWLFKVKFMDPEANYETKGESVAFQNETIKGLAVKLNFSYKVDGKDIHPWRIKAEEADNTVTDSKVFENWFKQVILPNIDLNAPASAPLDQDKEVVQ